MKTKLIIALALIAGNLVCLAQTISLSSTNQLGSDAKASASNVPGVQFPKIDSERRAYFHIAAPDAKKVAVGLSGGRRQLFCNQIGV